MSWTLVPRGYFHALKLRIASKRLGLLSYIRRGAVVVGYPGQALVMSKTNAPCRALSVLGDMHQPHPLGRNDPVSARVYLGSPVHCRTINKRDHICVLLDSSRFPKVGQQRCFIGALLNLTR